jgi:tetratricopeptide (TPR) repeat protein
MVVITGCASNQPSNELSQEHSELYQGQPIVSYLADQQAKTPEEAISRARQAEIQGDSDRALFEYIRAVELDPDHTQALLQIATIHYNRNNVRLAHLAYLKALTIDPDLIAAHQGTGQTLLRQKRYNLALESFTKAVELAQSAAANTDDAKTETTPPPPISVIKSYTGLGIIYDLKGMHELALQNYQEALKLNPRNKTVLNNLGYSYYLNSEWAKAENLFTRALHQDSGYKPAWKNLGLAYARQEKYMPALEALEQVMDTPQAYNDIGYICLLSKRYKQAAYFFREAISANPKYYQVAQQNLTRVKRMLASNPDGKSSL